MTRQSTDPNRFGPNSEGVRRYAEELAELADEKWLAAVGVHTDRSQERLREALLAVDGAGFLTELSATRKLVDDVLWDVNVRDRLEEHDPKGEEHGGLSRSLGCRRRLPRRHVAGP